MAVNQAYLIGDLQELRQRGGFRENLTPRMVTFPAVINRGQSFDYETIKARFLAAIYTCLNPEQAYGLLVAYGLEARYDAIPFVEERREAYAKEIGVTTKTLRNRERAAIETLAAHLMREDYAALSVGEALGRVAKIRNRVSGQSAAPQPALDAAARLLGEIQIDPALYVKRSIEDDLVRQITDSTDSEPHVIIGDAGHGKSTLLWSIYRRLKEETDHAVYFETAESIIEAWEQNTMPAAFAHSGGDCIFLIDTVDLLLHDEKSRSRFHQLLDLAYKSNFTVVCASRPLEARQISMPYLQRHQLGLYDETELRQAASALSHKYCPGIDANDLHGQFVRATARGLPVTDVCRSPLLLRMLFELSAPNAPELRDVDVTSLFESYWSRRVLRDARTESASVMHIDKNKDLSIAACAAGIGLLSCGMPEIAEVQLTQLTGSVAASFGRDDMAAAPEIEILKERGVLLANHRKLGFFHQTMFEFAAAKGVIASRQAARLMAVLTERTCAGHGDLFVGAVLEQMFVLARRNPLLLNAARQSVQTLLSSQSEAIQSIAVAAWGYDMSYLPEAFGRFTALPAAALERAVKIIPSIAGKPTGEMAGQLTVLWDANHTAFLRSNILSALSRVALSDAKTVAEALPYLDPLQSLKEYNDDDATMFRKALLGLLKPVCRENPQLTREMIVGMLYQKNGYADIELEYLTEIWSEIGGEDFLLEVLKALSDPQNPSKASADALGAIMAAEYVRAGLCASLDDWKDVVEELLNPDSEMDNAERTPQLYAIAHFLLTLEAGDKRLLFAAEHFLLAQGEYLTEIVGGCLLPMILTSNTPAAEYCVQLFAKTVRNIAKAALRNRLSAKQALVLYALSCIDRPNGLLGKVLPINISIEAWLGEPLLLRLLAAASMDHVPSAFEALALIENRKVTLTEESAGELFESNAAYFSTAGRVYDMLIDIAVRYKCGAELCNFINAADWQDKRLLPHISKLFAFGRQLLRGDEIDRINGMGLLSTLSDEADDDAFDWSEYHALLESLDDPELLCELLRAVGFQNEPGSVEARIDYFREFIEINDDADAPVQGTAKLQQYAAHEVFEDIAESIRIAFLELLTLHAAPNEAHWKAAKTLSLHTVGSETPELTCTAFSQVCAFLQRAAFLHEVETKQAERWLSQYLSDIVGVEFVGDIPELYGDALTEVIVTIMSENARFGLAALELAKQLSFDMAACIISIVAENSYELAREKLQQIAGELASARLKSFVLDVIRDHDRSSGTRVFAELIEAIALV